MITLFVLLLFQQTPSLSELISKAEAHWPNLQQTEYYQQVSELNIENIRAGRLPSLSLTLDASYQSDVTEINLPFPGTTAPTQLKERVTLGLQANQLIYDGGVLNKRAELESLQAEYQSKQVEVGLLNVRKSVSSLYFTALKLQKQSESLALYQKDVEVRMADLTSKVENGLIPKTALLILQAEQIKLRQSVREVEQNRNKVTSTLEILTGEVLSETSEFEAPILTVEGEEIFRPELQAFSIGYKQLQAKTDLTTSINKPKVSSFLQAAYGRPGLDIFDDSFTPYYIVGLKASWNFWDWNKTDRERQANQVQKNILQSQEQSFRQQLETTLVSTKKEAEKWEELAVMDDEIIAVKKEILEQYESQLNNGIITSNEYLTELNAYHQARLTKEIHHIKHIEATAELYLQRGAQL